MSSINQKEYLKKYLGIGKSSEKKKKKKKQKHVYGGIKIVDDNIDVNLSEEIKGDLDADNEDTPQIVAVIDERPPSLRIDEDTKSKLWKPIGEGSESQNSDVKLNSSFKLNSLSKLNTNVLNRSRSNQQPSSLIKQEGEDYAANNDGKLNDRMSPPRKVKVKEEPLTPERSSPRRQNEDISPPRRKNDDISPARRRNNDTSPPRRRNANLSPPTRNNDDLSPPRQRNDDLSPPRRRNNDLSPPRRRNNDLSPPRRRNDDLSPSRRRNNDLSPPRRRNNDSSPGRRRNNDLSPPRRGNKDSSPHQQRSRDDLSPPRKRADLSPTRKRKYDTSPPRNRRTSVSPPRKKKEQHKEPEVSRKSRWDKEDEGNKEKMKKTLDGKTAGLQNALELVHETALLKKREDEIFRNMSAEVSGANAATIVRGKKTEIDPEEQQRRLKKEKETKEKYDRWGKGLKQVEDHNQKMAEELHEMSKPLARYADDEDLERHLKDQEREGDPMLAYIRKKRKKEAIESGVPMKPRYQGEFMPNRFGIPPGYRWDGVNRSNGYEKKWFEVQNNEKASQEESYKWSTEDM